MKNSVVKFTAFVFLQYVKKSLCRKIMSLVSVVKLYSCLGIASSTVCFFFVLKLDVEGLPYCIEIRWLFRPQVLKKTPEWSDKWQYYFQMKRDISDIVATKTGLIFVNNQLTNNSFSCMYISILYMFRTAMCPSSGELIVSIRHLVYVTLYR